MSLRMSSGPPTTVEASAQNEFLNRNGKELESIVFGEGSLNPSNQDIERLNRRMQIQLKGNVDLMDPNSFEKSSRDGKSVLTREYVDSRLEDWAKNPYSLKIATSQLVGTSGFGEDIKTFEERLAEAKNTKTTDILVVCEKIEVIKFYSREFLQGLFGEIISEEGRGKFFIECSDNCILCNLSLEEYAPKIVYY